MDKGTLKQFVKGNTSHRLSKIVTLAVTSGVLVMMITIDASASGSPPSAAAQLPVYENSTPTSAFTNVWLKTFADRWNLVAPAAAAAAPTSGSGAASGGSGTASGGSSAASGGSGGASIGSGGSQNVLTTTAPPLSTTTTSPPTTTTTASSVPSAPTVSGGLITAGPSRSRCAELNFPDTGLPALQSAVTSFETQTSTSLSCLVAYLNGAPTWVQWEDPWVTASQYGYAPWVAESPQSRQLVLQVDLIPLSLKNVNNPLSWEQSCAAGNFNSYATQLGTNLVAAGLQNSVLRLGAEMNGTWETDFIGNTTQEQNLWAQCFANEVTALRQASGEHFLIDWNPNSCTENVPYANFYPGNSYVDILGLDFYDISCQNPSTALSFAQLASVPAGLTSFEAFAAAQGKPMSFPEWGLESAPAGDDPAYIDGVGSRFASGNFAFEAYFNAGAQGTLPLGSNTPLSLAAFQKWFGNS